jgi:hypothetical protein
MRAANAVLAVTLAIVSAGPAGAQRPEAGNYSGAEHRVVETRSVMVTMRDGVRVSVDLYRPVTTAPQAGILYITPYDNAGIRARARWFAERGFAVIAADSRGRFDSEGDWDPFTPHHKTDGYDLVEWIAKQPWSNGRVGMIGGSFGCSASDRPCLANAWYDTFVRRDTIIMAMASAPPPFRRRSITSARRRAIRGMMLSSAAVSAKESSSNRPLGV